MDSAKLNDWMQVFGIFAVVGSLIFVGMQMQQDREIALSQTYQARMDSTVGLLIASAENPSFLAGVSKGNSGNIDAITDIERLAAAQYATAILYLTENTHYQYLHGFVPEERWLGSKKTMEMMIEGTIGLPVRASFERNPELWSKEFREVIEQLIVNFDARKVEK